MTDSEPRRRQSDFGLSADSLTPVDPQLREPVNKTMIYMRRRIAVMMVVSVTALIATIIALAFIGYLMYYQTVTLTSWRRTSRAIQLETAQRVRETNERLVEQGRVCSELRRAAFPGTALTAGRRF